MLSNTDKRQSTTMRVRVVAAANGLPGVKLVVVAVVVDVALVAGQQRTSNSNSRAIGLFLARFVSYLLRI
jgi:hypothetical protein